MKEQEVNARTFAWMHEHGWGYVQGVMQGGDFRVHLTDDQWVGIDHFGRKNYSGDPNDVILIEDLGNCSSSGYLEHFYRLVHAGEIMLAQLILAMGDDDWAKFQLLLPRVQTINPLIGQRIKFLIHFHNGETKMIGMDEALQLGTKRNGSNLVATNLFQLNQNKSKEVKQPCREKGNPQNTGAPTRNSRQSALSDFLV